MPTIIRTEKYRLMPNAEQEEKLLTACAAARTIYNAANEQRIMYGRPKNNPDPFGRNSSFNRFRQIKEARKHFCKTLRGSNDEVVKETGIGHDPDLKWIYDYIPAYAVDYLFEDLDKAWDDFFKNRKSALKFKFPKFRSMNYNNSFKLRVWNSGEAANSKMLIVVGRSFIKIPKIGNVKLVKHKKLRGRLRTVTIKHQNNKWYASVTCEIKQRDTVHEQPSYVGIDLGVSSPVVMDDGTQYYIVGSSKEYQKKIKKLQRDLVKRKKGSNRYKKTKALMASYMEKEARRKNVDLHKITTDIVRRNSHIAIEDLNNKDMTQSAKSMRKNGKGAHLHNSTIANYNRAYLDIPKYEFRRQLDYKAEARNSVVLAVEPANTSRTCFVCGEVSLKNRVNQHTFKCCKCGHENHADVNAAQNILRKAFPNAPETGVVVDPRVDIPHKKYIDKTNTMMLNEQNLTLNSTVSMPPQGRMSELSHKKHGV